MPTTLKTYMKWTNSLMSQITKTDTRNKKPKPVRPEECKEIELIIKNFNYFKVQINKDRFTGEFYGHLEK